MYRPRQRLLHVHVLARLHARFGDHGVGVIRRGDDHAVQVGRLGQHGSEVRELPRRFVLLLPANTFGALPPLAVAGPLQDFAGHQRVVDVTHGGDVLSAQRLGVLPAHPASADDGHVQRVRRGAVAGTAEHVGRHDHGAKGGPGTTGDEVASRQISWRHGSPVSGCGGRPGLFVGSTTT